MADPVTEESFRKTYEYEKVAKPSLRKRLWKTFGCTKETGANLFPIARWLRKYNVRKDLISDMLAGLTVAIMHIPHGLSYAPLGHVEPVVGLYMAVFPVIVYMLMGTSRHVSLGTFAIVCAMVGDIVVQHATGPGNVSGTVNATVRHSNVDLATAICLSVGLWQSLFGLLRLGIIGQLISDPIVSGFTNGAAIYVFSYQLKHLFGVTVPTAAGPLSLLWLYANFFSAVKSTNMVTLGISAVCIAILVVFNDVVKPFVKKMHPDSQIPVPAELFVIAVSIPVSHYLKLSENYGVDTVRFIPEDFPRPKVPPLHVLPDVMMPSLQVALVALIMHLSLAKIFARKGDYVLSENQELVACGVSNIFASFFLCLPSTASLSRSTIQFASGGKTQLTGLFSAILMIFVILFAGPLFEPVPFCVLSAVVVVTLRAMLFQFVNLPGLWRMNTLDGLTWIATFLTVVVAGVNIGLTAGIVLSVATVLYASLDLQVSVMGRVPGTNIFLDLTRYRSAAALPGILVLQIEGLACYGNCTALDKKILSEFERFSAFSIDEPETSVVLDLKRTTRIDSAVVETFRHLDRKLSHSKSTLYLASCNDGVYSVFEACRFFEEFPRDRIFASLPDAINYLTDSS